MSSALLVATDVRQLLGTPVIFTGLPCHTPFRTGRTQNPPVPNAPRKDHRFGGDWTAAKLRVLGSYLAAYRTALSKTPFRVGYIDAFAGTGYRSPSRVERPDSLDQLDLFPDLAEVPTQELLDGSARIALRVQPGFDRYVFIEKREDRCQSLEALRDEFPNAAPDIRIRRGEANDEIRKICDANWSGYRAVLFLDPYGMQVEWTTIQAIAATRAIDLWLLFPLGMGVNRLLTRSGDIPESWQHRLDVLLGTTEWRDEFYRFEIYPDLFGGAPERVTKASMDVIGRYFEERLRGVFAGVATPGVLRNSSNAPLYLLCFASGNPRGAKIAARIAKHLLKDLI